MLSPKVDHSNQSHIIADSDLISYICDVNIDDLKGYISEHSDCINQYYEYYPISNNNDDTYENNSNDENKVLPMIVTPLLLAVSLGSLAIVSILVSQYQADINLPLMINGEQHDLQQTPLYIACSKNHIAIVSLLLNTNHADISISDKVCVVFKMFAWTSYRLLIFIHIYINVYSMAYLPSLLLA